MPIQFPPGFLWGAATSAYQIEGSPLADGAGQSIWHRFAHTNGRTAGGDTGDIACDHYRRMPQDVALMRELGLQAYRFSIAWARVFPEGSGRVNPAGLDFYDRLVDTLLEAGIEPLATLYHWDMPAALDDRGGWLNRDVADWFADYAAIMFEKLDGRVKRWCTINEPWVITDGGYLHGVLAPGHKNLFETPIASHNILRAHGQAVRRYREAGAHAIGIVLNLEPKHPASDAPEDIATANRADAYFNRQYLDPLYGYGYPAEMAEVFGRAWPEFPAEDFDLIAAPTDWLGINWYSRSVVRHDPSCWPVGAGLVRQLGSTYTDVGWEVAPAALTETLTWIAGRYGSPPIYVTENGSAFYDAPIAERGRVHDPLRVSYLRQHLAAVSDAIAKGVDVRGYMAWSFMDNLEWSLGFAKRFGIVHVDFATQTRTIKDSGRLYAEVIASNGAVLNAG